MTQFTEAQEQWLQALEGGEWEQGYGSLWQMTDGQKCWCCLGVATAQLFPNHKFLDDFEGESFSKIAPPGVVKMLKLRGECGRILKPEIGACALTEMNDNGATFAEIAAFIRANPWQVFKNFEAPA